MRLHGLLICLIDDGSLSQSRRDMRSDCPDYSAWYLVPPRQSPSKLRSSFCPCSLVPRGLSRHRCYLSLFIEITQANEKTNLWFMESWLVLVCKHTFNFEVLPLLYLIYMLSMPIIHTMIQCSIVLRGSTIQGQPSIT